MLQTTQEHALIQGLEGKAFPLNCRTYLNVKHWSGCWGGHVVTREGNFSRKTFKSLRRNELWLDNFLQRSYKENTNVEQATHTEDGRHSRLAGQEYILRVQILNPPEDASLSVVACIDGKTAFSLPEYEEYEQDIGGFKGYSLKRGRNRYTLQFPYIHTPEGYCEHTSFSTNDTTVIGVHLFIDREGHTAQSNSPVPKHTSIIFYCPRKK